MSTAVFRPNTVGWFEITTAEPELAEQFYRSLFDWRFTAFDSEYHTITAPDAAVATGALRRGGRDALCISVICDDLTATIPRLEALGATVVEPPARTPAGDLHAIVTDAQGNRIGLFAPAAQRNSAPGPQPPTPNSLAWFEIGTTDFAASRKFYEQAFGWRYERDEAAEGVAYYNILVEGASEPIGGMVDLSAGPTPTDYAIPGLLVADVPDLLERCERAGGQRVMGPFPDGNGLIIGQFTDRFGNRWSSFARPADG
ncbi:VOC family protein [Nocardia sp. CDC159]|uniref:VOC family protein n=1 Tax=Nocardia pulmonis TaxID=2951408 RepID=A0A9X2IZN3_9NOCA|nr:MULTISPECIES: VOC family protein [Nocardia]MCM6778282.1 VOC family protein [Nocardia pulmonis]MCM6791171.1 VOC family protein [Nocardia sp. CDC159]